MRNGHQLNKLLEQNRTEQVNIFISSCCLWDLNSSVGFVDTFLNLSFLKFKLRATVQGSLSSLLELKFYDPLEKLLKLHLPLYIYAF